MQHRYVADIGDYVKLAILRKLSPGRILGVAWWLFRDENHNRDGSHRKYLERPQEWGHFDPELFDALLTIDRQKKQNISAIENASVLPDAVFASDPVPCDAQPFSLRPAKRREWLVGVETRLERCNLIFLDPDNGIASEK